MSKKRFKDGVFKMLSVKLTEDEFNNIKRNAHGQEKNVSEYIRALTITDKI